MKKILILVVGLVSLVAASSACAHAPSGMVLDYNAETQALQATIAHSSGTPSAHYVERVDVFINDVPMMQLMPPAQNDPVLVIDLSSFKLMPEDVVVVQAFCNRGGDITETWILTAAEEPAQAQ